jgi:hypothetical protein
MKEMKEKKRKGMIDKDMTEIIPKLISTASPPVLVSAKQLQHSPRDAYAVEHLQTLLSGFLSKVVERYMGKFYAFVIVYDVS